MKNNIYLSTILMAFGLFFSCQSADKQPTENQTIVEEMVPVDNRINADQAMRLAEAFVASQGYTDQEVDLGTSKLIFEKGEYATDTSKILEMRQNTLRPQALHARTYGEKNNKWIVGFNYEPPENNIVRGVAMDSIGGTMIMQSQEVKYNWLLDKAD